MLQALLPSPNASAAPSPEIAALICLLLSDVSAQRQAGLLAHPDFGPLIRAAFTVVECGRPVPLQPVPLQRPNGDQPAARPFGMRGGL